MGGVKQQATISANKVYMGQRLSSQVGLMVLLLKLHYCVFLAPFGLGGLSPAAAITV